MAVVLKDKVYLVLASTGSGFVIDNVTTQLELVEELHNQSGDKYGHEDVFVVETKLVDPSSD